MPGDHGRQGGIDRAIRLSTAAAVLAAAGIAAYVSYGHTYAAVRAHGETGITARLEPATIDGLVYASSMNVHSPPPRQPGRPFMSGHWHHRPFGRRRIYYAGRKGAYGPNLASRSSALRLGEKKRRWSGAIP